MSNFFKFPITSYIEIPYDCQSMLEISALPPTADLRDLAKQVADILKIHHPNLATDEISLAMTHQLVDDGILMACNNTYLLRKIADEASNHATITSLAQMAFDDQKNYTMPEQLTLDYITRLVVQMIERGTIQLGASQ